MCLPCMWMLVLPDPIGPVSALAFTRKWKIYSPVITVNIGFSIYPITSYIHIPHITGYIGFSIVLLQRVTQGLPRWLTGTHTPDCTHTPHTHTPQCIATYATATLHVSPQRRGFVMYCLLVGSYIWYYIRLVLLDYLRGLNLLFASTSAGANRSYFGSSYTSIIVISYLY